MEQVSEEVKRKAEQYASSNVDVISIIDMCIYDAVKKAFIAGASYMKPIEHEQQQPINGHEEK